MEDNLFVEYDVNTLEELNFLLPFISKFENSFLKLDETEEFFEAIIMSNIDSKNFSLH